MYNINKSQESLTSHFPKLNFGNISGTIFSFFLEDHAIHSYKKDQDNYNKNNSQIFLIYCKKKLKNWDNCTISYIKQQKQKHT